MTDTTKLEQLAEVLANYLAPNDHNFKTAQKFMKETLLEFAEEIRCQTQP